MKQPEEKPGTTFVQPSVPEKGIIMSLLDVFSLFSPKIFKPNLFCEIVMLPYQICLRTCCTCSSLVWRCLICDSMLFLWCHDILKNLKTRSLLRKRSHLSRWQSKKNNPHWKVLSAVCFQFVYCYIHSVLIVCLNVFFIQFKCMYIMYKCWYLCNCNLQFLLVSFSC